jgi:hypothetical protein
VAQKVASGVYKGVTTSELDELAAETAASMTSKHPDYAQVRRTRPSPALSGSVWHDKTSAFRGSTLSSRMLLFPNVRDADRPALTSPIPPPRSSPPASRSPTCTRTPRSPSPRRTSLARAHAARFRPPSRRVSDPEVFQTSDSRVSVSRGFENAPERSAPTRAPASSTRIPRPEGSDRLATPDADRRLTSATKKTAA